MTHKLFKHIRTTQIKPVYFRNCRNNESSKKPTCLTDAWLSFCLIVNLTDLLLMLCISLKLWAYCNISKPIRSPPCHHLTPGIPIKLFLASFSVISHLKKCTCAAFMRYHVSFCCNSLFSGQINGKQMCLSITKHKSLRKVMRWDSGPNILPPRIRVVLFVWGKLPDYLSVILSQSKYHPLLFNLSHNDNLSFVKFVPFPFRLI